MNEGRNEAIVTCRGCGVTLHKNTSHYCPGPFAGPYGSEAREKDLLRQVEDLKKENEQVRKLLKAQEPAKNYRVFWEQLRRVTSHLPTEQKISLKMITNIMNDLEGVDY